MTAQICVKISVKYRWFQVPSPIKIKTSRCLIIDARLTLGNYNM